jgi:nucleoside-diphosphate-sugar epimerase
MLSVLINTHMLVAALHHGVQIYFYSRQPVFRKWNAEILEPINLGSSEMVTINQLVGIVEEIAGIKLNRSYDLSSPKSVVNGRNSDNTHIQKDLRWEPSTPLKVGMEKLDL